MVLQGEEVISTFIRQIGWFLFAKSNFCPSSFLDKLCLRSGQWVKKDVSLDLRASFFNMGDLPSIGILLENTQIHKMPGLYAGTMHG